MAIIPSTGPVTMTDINNEFGKGLNLYAYRGVKWYRPDNSRGVFDGLTGNNPPIDFDEFRGKVAALAITPSGPTSYANGSTFTFPNYNKITITVTGGSGGGAGANGYNSCFGAQQVTAGGSGSPGSPSNAGGSYSAAGGGAGTAGETAVYVFDAEANTVTKNGVIVAGATPPLKGIPFLISVGGGGAGGGGGTNSSMVGSNCVFFANSPDGSPGAAGSVTIQVA
jgi:hypothetical protein